MADGNQVKVIVIVVIVAVLALIIGLVATSLKKLDSFESKSKISFTFVTYLLTNYYFLCQPINHHHHVKLNN